MRRKGKLEAYLAEIEKNNPKKVSEKSNNDEESESVNINEIWEQYKAIKQFDKENFVLYNQIELDNTLEEEFEPKKVKKRKRKKKVVVEEQQPNIILDEAEFKPKMAGRTGLPTFFFTNLVQKNKSVFARCRITCRPKKADQSL